MININKKYIDINQIKVEVFTIGKDSNGEANILLFFIDDTVEYSIVIDCCENDINIIKEKIFDKYNITRVDMICWTHPHLDHSKGIMKLLKDYSDKKTKVIFPSELEIVYKCMNSEARKVYNYVTSITEKSRTDKGIYRNATQNTELEYITYVQTNGINNFDFKIISLSPIPRRVLNMKNNCKHDLGKKCSHNFNEYSIALIVEINKCFFLFTGDIENETIEEIEKYTKLDNVLFSKIPHHGSNTSTNLLEVYDIDTCKSMICTTTALLKKNKFNILPNNEVLEEYKKIFGNVFCTSSSYINKKFTRGNFGIIESEFKIPINPEMNEVKSKIYLSGDAIQI